ncbi:MAG: hypothetical protein U1A78_14085 [Polyangia bacterium]
MSHPLHRLLARLSVAAVLVGSTGVAVVARAQAAGVTAARPDPVAAAQRELGELTRLLGERNRLVLAQKKAEREQAQRGQEIERLKAQPPGVAPSLRLQEALAQSQAQATQLSQQAAELLRLDQQVQAARSRVLKAIDAVLLADGADERAGSGPRLGAAERLQWLRLRTEQAEALLGPDGLDERVRDLAQRSASEAQPGGVPGAGPGVSNGNGNGGGGPELLDDPQVLRERADLLRDAADKLQREVTRLKARSDEVQKRQRLRDRAARVDEDLFAEQATARRAQRGDTRLSNEATGAPAAAADSGGKSGVAAPVPASPAGDFASAPSGPVRGLDPSTLDVLQRAEGTGDPAARLAAMQRVQSELNRLTEQLNRRASRLEQRARELGQRK